MRAPWVAALGLVAALAMGSALGIPPADADPAYKAEAVVAFFSEAAKNQLRPICIGKPPECPAQGLAAVFVLADFAYGSDKLSPAAKQDLDQFAKALKDPRLNWQKFEIDGHADASGDEPYNLGLSERRAASVVAYLASKGLDRPYSLIAKGYGNSRPRVSDPFSPDNRRVEARMLGAVR